MKIRIVSILTSLVVLFAPSVNALEVDISGYASFAATKADAQDTSGNNVIYNNGLAGDNVQFDTADSILGLQFSASVSDNIDMTVVLNANGAAGSNYEVTADWAYATYRFSDELSLRMGKYKGSFYMVSDYQDVGYAYPWVRPPQEVYSTNPIKALSGLNLVYQSSLGDMTLLTELYAGSGTHNAYYLPIVADTPTPNGLGNSALKGTTTSFETPNSAGINVSLSGDVGTFRVGYYSTDVNSSTFGITEQKGEFFGVGFNMDWNNLVIYSEYVDRDTAPTLAGAFPDQKAYYATFGYRVGKYLPYVTGAKIEKGKDASTFAQEQSSVALGMRYEVSDTSALKFEVLKATPKDSGYGLFYNTTEEGTIATAKFDLIF